MRRVIGMSFIKYVHCECWLTVLSLAWYILKDYWVIGVLITEYMVRFKFRVGIRFRFGLRLGLG